MAPTGLCYPGHASNFPETIPVPEGADLEGVNVAADTSHRALVYVTEDGQSRLDLSKRGGPTRTYPLPPADYTNAAVTVADEGLHVQIVTRNTASATEWFVSYDRLSRTFNKRRACPDGDASVTNISSTRTNKESVYGCQYADGTAEAMRVRLVKTR